MGTPQGSREIGPLSEGAASSCHDLLSRSAESLRRVNDGSAGAGFLTQQWKTRAGDGPAEQGVRPSQLVVPFPMMALAARIEA